MARNGALETLVLSSWRETNKNSSAKQVKTQEDLHDIITMKEKDRKTKGGSNLVSCLCK